MHHADLTRMAVVLAVAGLASPVLAHGEGDIGLLLQGNRIVTAVADDEAGTFADIGERVFAGEIDFVSNVGDDPGFFTTDGAGIPGGFSAFSPGKTISYQTNGAIMEWDGSTFVSTSNQLRQIVIPGVIEILSPTDGSVVPGFEYSYNGGEFDEHPDYAMLDDSARGIFLWKIAFNATDEFGDLIASSDEVWVVFDFGLGEFEHELALEWAEKNIPSPGVLVPLAIGGLAAARRRR